MQSFQELFLTKLKDRLSDLLGLESEAIFSYYLGQSPIQDPFRYRAKYLGLRVASLLIDEKGELNGGMLRELNQLLDQGGYLLGPDREGDASIWGHIKNCLQQLAGNKEVWASIRKFSPPICHKKAEEVVKETLWPEPIRILREGHIRKAVIASWLTPLRQTTGSCFATAPAILIQQHEPLRFFKDLYDLLTIGQMKRTMGGKEYSVPLSFSGGSGDLQRIVSGPFFGLSIALDAVQKKFTKKDGELMRDMGPQTVEEVLRRLLLDDAGLDEEVIQDEEHLARIQMTPLLAKQGAVFYQRPSERAQRVAEWKRRFEKACTSFKTITECALLRSWEYSIASFCDVKTEFARWNLFIGLGLHPDQKNGVGAFLYEEINGRLQKCHREIERFAKEYEVELSAIQALETMIHGALNELRRNQLKAEWMTRSSSASSIAERRNRLIAQADSLVALFSWLVEKYDVLLQEYFQELFDPILSREEAHIHDDSPAGFRLVYKHGRHDASQWTAIYTKEQYIGNLRDFFSRAENELDPPPHIGKELIGEITTALIQYIQEDRFLESAIARSKEKGRLSPWDYLSGGTLQTLLMAYNNRNQPFTEKSVVPHSAEELLEFLAGSGKTSPCLMHSPSHAFIFYPSLLENRFQLRSGANQKWSGAMQERLANKLSERLPEEEKALFLHLLRKQNSPKTNGEFRNQLIEALSPRIKNREALADSVLYENGILFGMREANEALAQILSSIRFEGRPKKMEGEFFGSLDLYNQAKFSILETAECAHLEVDWDRKIAEEMRKWGFMPDALLFADSNWSGWFLGFVNNPATNQLQLWRLNRSGSKGFPMNDWSEWIGPLNASSWVLLTEPEEYISL